MREIVLDTETTGLSPQGGDRVVEIGCVELMNRVPTGRTFHAYFNPCRPMPFEAEAVHGLSEVFLSDKPLFQERCDELLDFLADAPLVAHNAPFDFGFLNHELSLCGLPPICTTTRMICTLLLARQRLPGVKHSLDALCTRYGVDRSIRIKHGALIDAQLLAQVYVELTGGRQIGLGLVAEEAASQKIEMVLVDHAPTAITLHRTPRHHAPSAEELARHAEFLRNLSDPLWNRLEACH
jgi:DNA polymerase-3 subunit epsilon